MKDEEQKKEKKESEALNALKSGLKLEGLTGLLKIALIFVGVMVVLVVALPLSPFITYYFVYDRKKTHVERMSKVDKKKAVRRVPIPSINDWANERGADKETG